MGYVTDAFKQAADYYQNPSLNGIVIIGAQHILGSVVEMFSFLETLGLDLSKVFLMGKCYSSSSFSYEKLVEKGAFVSKNSFSFDSHQSFDLQYSTYVERFIDYVFGVIDWESCRRIVVLDDGGILISALQQRSIPKDIKIVGAEQTSAGYYLIKDQKLMFPVINVARSKAKLQLETPHIVESFLKKFREYVCTDTLIKSKILVLGKGVIGSALQEALKDYSVECYDAISSRKELLFPLISRADIIFGCSGSTSIPERFYKFLKKGVILASASSSDREFDAMHIRREFPSNSNPLTHYTLNDMTLLQSGFPLNFWGTPHNIPLEKISITISLLIAAVMQSVLLEDMSSQIVDLEDSFEKSIIFFYKKLYGEDVFLKHI